MVLAEGAVDNNGAPIKAESIRSLIETKLAVETRVTVLGHTQRGGRASYFDRFMVRPCDPDMATLSGPRALTWDRTHLGWGRCWGRASSPQSTMQGVEAIEAILKMTPETASQMIGMNGNAITRLPLVDCVEQTLAVGEALRSHNFKRALDLRGPEFVDAYRTFRTIARAEPRNHETEGPNVRTRASTREGAARTSNGALAHCAAGHATDRGACAACVPGSPFGWRLCTWGRRVVASTRRRAPRRVWPSAAATPSWGERWPVPHPTARHMRRALTCTDMRATAHDAWSSALAASIRNGFDGLLAGQVDELDWMSVNEWASKGGSKLGGAAAPACARGCHTQGGSDACGEDNRRWSWLCTGQARHARCRARTLAWWHSTCKSIAWKRC